MSAAAPLTDAPWADACEGRLCLCGKAAAAVTGELAAGRAAAAAARGQSMPAPPPARGPGRMGVLGSHVLAAAPAAAVVAAAAAAAAGGGGGVPAEHAEMVALLQELIAIPSVNPDQVRMSGVDPITDPNCGEHPVATALGAKFEALGGEVVLEDCTPSWIAPVAGFGPRTNVYVSAAARPASRSSPALSLPNPVPLTGRVSGGRRTRRQSGWPSTPTSTQ